MPWIKLTDDWYEDGAIIDAGDLGTLLWVLGLSWSARNLTDGYVPAKAIGRLVDMRSPGKVASHLVDIGLWSVADGGWQIVNYAKYQPSRASVEAKRAAESERKARGRRQMSARTDADVRPLSARESARPIPSHPIPSPAGADKTTLDGYRVVGDLDSAAGAM